MGDQSKQAVRSANMQVSRMCLLMLLAYAKMCAMLLEQPRSSVMKMHNRMQQYPYCDLWCSSTCMGAFDEGRTAKPTSLFSNQILLLALLKRYRYLTPQQRQQMSASSARLVRAHYSSRGDVKITGRPQLKAIQIYSTEHAREVVGSHSKWYKRHRPSMKAECIDSSDSDYSDCTPDEWHDAQLKPVAKLWFPSRAVRLSI